jgi:outer membrane protein assembly factor BamB
VHLRTESRIVTLNASTGVLQWAQPPPAEHFNWAASGAGLFYATSTQVVRLDPATGAVLWQRLLPASIASSGRPPSFTCNDESVFLATMYDHEAWDAATGEQQWHVDQHGSDLAGSARPDWTIDTVDPQIGTSDRTILIEQSAGTACRVSARSARNGATLWTAPIDGVGISRFDLALGRDTLYVLPLDADRAAAVVHAISIV